MSLPSAPSAVSGLKVVLIEDNPLLREILSEMFQDMGVQLCASAEDQTGALRALESQPVDLAIVDIELREGSGIGVLEALRSDPKRYGSPRTVILSNHAHPSMRKRCAALGSDAFFDKSLQMEQFVSYVQDAVERHDRTA